MIEIKDLLGRFQNILLSEEGKNEAVREVISEVIKTKISSKDIKVRKGTIYLNIKPIYKNEILIKQEEIFRKLQELFPDKFIAVH
jgi:hypothetical protein